MSKRRIIVHFILKRGIFSFKIFCRCNRCRSDRQDRRIFRYHLIATSADFSSECRYVKLIHKTPLMIPTQNLKYSGSVL